MNALSLGDIARLACYSRVRIYQLAVNERIPFKAIKRPPEGQFRFADTPELRAWCQAMRSSKPKALKRKAQRPRKFTPIYEAARIIKSGKATMPDLENALKLLESCRGLFLSVVVGEQPCTSGVLALASHNLLRSYSSRCSNAFGLAKCYDETRVYLEKAIAKLPKSPKPSQTAPALRKTKASPALA